MTNNKKKSKGLYIDIDSMMSDLVLKKPEMLQYSDNQTENSCINVLTKNNNSKRFIKVMSDGIYRQLMSCNDIKITV